MSAVNLPLSFVFPVATGPGGMDPRFLPDPLTKIATRRLPRHFSFLEVTLPLNTQV